MSKYFHILVWMPLLYAVIFVSIWIKIYTNEYVAFEEYVIEKQCNYAADSSMEAMLHYSNLGLDYADNEFASLNPTIGKDDFVDTMCMNWGLLVNDSNRELFETKYLRSLVIATYDGAYVYTVMKEDDQGDKALVQSPKIPYTYQDTEGNNYTLTLDNERGYADSGNVFPASANVKPTYALHRLGKYAMMSGVKQPTNDVQKTVISDTVSRLLNWSLYETLSMGGKEDVVAIPAISNSIKGGQAIDRPTVIGVVRGMKTAFSTPILAGGIGGAQLTDNTDIIGCDLIGYTIDGIPYTGKFYSTADWWDRHTSKEGFKTNERYFDSRFEAARTGYNDLTTVR